MSDPCDMVLSQRPIWRFETDDNKEFVVYSNGSCTGFPSGIVCVNSIQDEVARRLEVALKYNALVIPLSFCLHKIFQRLKDKVFGTRPHLLDTSEIRGEDVP